jgi:hypothetical protein
MGFMSLRTASTWALIACLFSLAACSKTKKDEVSEAEITSINVYFSNADVSGQQVGKIYSYNPANGVSTELASFNDGDGMAIALDTDESKPGFEYAAYVEDKTVKLLDYSKTASQRIYELQTFTQDICGLEIAERPAPSVFDSTSEYYLSTLHDTAINVVIKNGGICDRKTDRYFNLDFDTRLGAVLTNSREVKNSEVFGAYLIDRSFEEVSSDTGETITGRSVWLSHDRDTQTLRLRQYKGAILAEIPFQYAINPPFIESISDSLLLIQRDSELFKVTLSQLSDMVAARSSAVSTNRVTAFFNNPLVTMSLADDSMLVDYDFEARFLVFADDNGIYRHNINAALVEQLYIKEPAVTSIKLAIMNNGTLVLAKQYATHESLTTIAEASNSSELVLVNNAQSIEYRQDGIRIYANVLNTSNIGGEPLTTASWSAVQFNATSLEKLMEESLFVFSKASSKQTDRILLLVASEPAVGESLLSPYVYQYDSSAPGGKLVFQELSEDEKQIVSVTEGTYGQILSDVYGALNSVDGSNFLVNEEFGGFQIETAASLESYFYRPKQSASEEEAKKEPSLSLVKEDIPTTNKTSFNAFFSSLKQSGSDIAP